MSPVSALARPLNGQALAWPLAVSPIQGQLLAALALQRAAVSMVFVGRQLLHQGFSCRRSSFPCHAAALPGTKTLLPNPSLVGTATGKALGPRGRRSYHRPRGPSAFPAPAPQLKR